MTVQDVWVNIHTPNGIIRNPLSVEYTQVRNGVGSASFRLASLPFPLEPEAFVRIAVGYQGAYNSYVFTGLVDRVEVSLQEGTATVYCRDLLKKAMDTFLIQEVKFGIDVEQQKYYYSTYTAINGGEFTVHEYTSLDALHTNHPETTDNITVEGVKAEAVVQWLLVMSGLQEGSQIQVYPSNFYIGDIKPVTFHLVSIYDAIVQIAELLGWELTCSPNGTVYFYPRDREFAQPFLVRAYSTVATNAIPALEYTVGISNEDLRNYVEVVGASGIRHVERASSPYLGTTPYRGVLISNELIDTPGIASYIARRTLSDLNRLKRTYRVTTVGDWRLHVFRPIRIEDTYHPVRRGKVESLQGTVNESGYRVTMEVTDYLDDVLFDEPIEDVELAYTITYILTIGDPTIIATFDASDTHATIKYVSTYRWTINGVDYGERTEPYITIGLDKHQLQTTGVPVILTVTFTDGTTATDTDLVYYEDVVPPGSAELYPNLFAALTTMAACSTNGGETWTTYPIPAISVAASDYDQNVVEQLYAPYALFGCSDGSIYRYEDSVLTQVSYGVPPVTLVTIHPKHNRYAYAIKNDDRGDLWVSTDGGFTFSPTSLRDLFNYGDRIVDVETIYDDPMRLYILTPVKILLVTLDDIYDGEVSVETIIDLSTVNEGHPLYEYRTYRFTHFKTAPYGGKEHAFIGLRRDIPSMSYMVIHTTDPRDAHSYTLIPPQTYNGVPVAALTPDLTRPLVHIVGENATLYNAYVDESDSQNTSSQLVPALSYNPMTFSHMLRDGTFTDLIYYATSSGVYKSIDGNHSVMPLYIPEGVPPSGGWGKQVAYGPMRPRQQVQLTNLLVHAHRLDDLYEITAVTSGVFVTSYVPAETKRTQTMALALVPTISGGVPSTAVSSGFAWIKYPTYCTSYQVGSVGGRVAAVIATVEGTPQSGDPPFPPGFSTSRCKNMTLFFDGEVTQSGLTQLSLRPFQVQAFTSRDVRHDAVWVSTSSTPVVTVQMTTKPLNSWGVSHDVQFGIAAGLFTKTNTSILPSIGTVSDMVSGYEFNNGTGSRIYIGPNHPAPHANTTESMFTSLRGGHPFWLRSFPINVHMRRANPSFVFGDYDHFHSFDLIPVAKFNAVSYQIAAQPKNRYPYTDGSVQARIITADPKRTTLWHNIAPEAQLVLVVSRTNPPTLELLSWDRELLGGSHYAGIIGVSPSYADISAVYYATPYRVRKVLNYGRGSREVIFEVPPEFEPEIITESGITTTRYGISMLAVTPGRTPGVDYITVVVEKMQAGLLRGYIYYSLDSGATWHRHAWRARDSLGYLFGAWLV